MLTAALTAFRTLLSKLEGDRFALLAAMKVRQSMLFDTW
jgi:hypothetical protein